MGGVRGETNTQITAFYAPNITKDTSQVRKTSSKYSLALVVVIVATGHGNSHPYVLDQVGTHQFFVCWCSCINSYLEGME